MTGLTPRGKISPMFVAFCDLIGGEIMKLTIYYENLKEELDVNTDEMWSCLGLTTDKELSEEEREKMIQDKVDKEWNRNEYNNWHRFDRHRANVFNPTESKLCEVMDIFPDIKEAEKIRKYEEYKDVCRNIREILKGRNDWADIVIAIALDGYSVTEYARYVGSSRKAISKKYNKALNLLKKFYKGFRNDLSRGLYTGGVI